MEKYKVIIFGCGVMGRKTAQALLDKATFEIVGAVDIDPELPPEPVIGEKVITTAFGEVQPGDVIGLTSFAFGKKDGKEVITLEFCANAAVEEEYDEIIIEGEPNLHQKIMGGVHGDIGTVAVTVNTIPRAVEAPPGVVVMKDLPPPNAVQ